LNQVYQKEKTTRFHRSLPKIFKFSGKKFKKKPETFTNLKAI